MYRTYVLRSVCANDMITKPRHTPRTPVVVVLKLETTTDSPRDVVRAHHTTHHRFHRLLLGTWGEGEGGDGGDGGMTS